MRLNAKLHQERIVESSTAITIERLSSLIKRLRSLSQFSSIEGLATRVFFTVLILAMLRQGTQAA